jgi:formamidopyrimidine-DNA glycosylase
MPELPEVEVVRRGLERWVKGRTVVRAAVLHPRPVRRHLAGPDDFSARLRGVVVSDVLRRGKFLWLVLDSGEALLAHLGMSGQLVLQPPGAPDEPHLRVRLELAARVGAGGAGGAGEDDGPRELRFVDQRMFGGLWLGQFVDGADPGVPLDVAHIARDPLDPHFDEADFARRLLAKRTTIKRALLDQTLISGIGNIYADEALWRAKLHYDRPTASLSRAKVAELLGAVRDVMDAALAEGGTSFDSLYVNVNGESGYFERSLNAYGQEGEPCPRCGTAIRREAFMKRSSYFCPHCQRRPRRAL